MGGLWLLPCVISGPRFPLPRESFCPYKPPDAGMKRWLCPHYQARCTDETGLSSLQGGKWGAGRWNGMFKTHSGDGSGEAQACSPKPGKPELQDPLGVQVR